MTIMMTKTRALHGRFRVTVRRQAFDVDVRHSDGRVVAVRVLDGSAAAAAAGVGRRMATDPGRRRRHRGRGESLAEARLFS